MSKLTTQIGSTPRPRKTILSNVRKELERLDIKVTHPKDGLVFSKNNWTEYEQQVAFFESIARSSFHTIWNEGGEITKPLALQIIYALNKNRPLVFLKNPLYGPEVDAFARETIAAHTRQFTVANLSKMEPAELNFMLKNLPAEIDYQLSSREKVLIGSRVKAYFRALLTRAKTGAHI